MRGVDVAYGRRAALEDVSFEVPPGRVVGVIGPNGAGKSTLFKAILGVLRHSGSVQGRGRRPAYVPQGDAARLDLPVTVLDVALIGRHQQPPGGGRCVAPTARRAARPSTRWGWPTSPGGRWASSPAASASAPSWPGRSPGGEVMLLDEPLTGVDTTSQEAILGVLGRLRDEGRAILMATHDLAQASRTCDLLLFLNRRVAFGPPQEAFTAEVLAGTYGGDLLVVDAPGGRALVLDDPHHRHGSP